MVLADIPTFEIIQQFSPSRDQLKQSAAGIIIFLVYLKMLGQFVDALRKQRDLYL